MVDLKNKKLKKRVETKEDAYDWEDLELEQKSASIDVCLRKDEEDIKITEQEKKNIKKKL